MEPADGKRSEEKSFDIYTNLSLSAICDCDEMEETLNEVNSLCAPTLQRSRGIHFRNENSLSPVICVTVCAVKPL